MTGKHTDIQTGNIEDTQFVVGDRNRVTGNRVTGAAPTSHTEELRHARQLIAELRGKLAELESQVSTEQAHAIRNRIDQAATELDEKDPDPKMWSKFLLRLKETANAVGDIATPIVTTVTQLQQLFR